MKSFLYKGKFYRSLAEFADIHKVSYQKLKRYCRHFKRARDNPAIAVAWVMGQELLEGQKEVRTSQFTEDMRKGYERYCEFLERRRFKQLETVTKK